MVLNLAVICQPITFQMSRFDVYYFVSVNRRFVLKTMFVCYRQRNGNLCVSVVVVVGVGIPLVLWSEIEMKKS